jgi:hypothetical protein
MTNLNIANILKTNSIIGGFLSEAANISSDEYASLTEEFKSDTAEEIVADVLANIKTKMSAVDTSDIDKSRGDIKNYQNLQLLQNTIKELSDIAVHSPNGEELNAALVEVENSIGNLAKTAKTFKDAYREKKTFLMLKYEAVVSNIVAVLSYLVSMCVDIGPDGTAKLKDDYDVETLHLMKTLEKFNSDVSSEIFESMNTDTTELRKFYMEYTPEQFATIYEAGDIMTLINQGIDAFNRQLNGGNSKMSALLYKFSGIVMLILSIRDVFYSLYAYKDKISDYIGNLTRFVNLGSSSLNQLTKFLNFNQKSTENAQIADRQVATEIAAENTQIVHKAQQDSTMMNPVSMATVVANQTGTDITSALEKEPAADIKSVGGIDF